MIKYEIEGCASRGVILWLLGGGLGKASVMHAELVFFFLFSSFAQSFVVYLADTSILKRSEYNPHGRRKRLAIALLW